MTNHEEKTVFSKGDDVPEDGKYVCSPCGYHHQFHKGEKFTECISCMSGTDDGHEDFVEGVELWEKARKVDTSPLPPPVIEE